MVVADVVAAKLADAEHRIRRVRRHTPETAELLAGDPDAFDLVAFNLMLAVQCCLDVASHLIADQGWPPAVDLASSFERLQENEVLTVDTARALARAAGLRNVVAHVYARADPELVFRAATEGLEDLERFASEVASWLSSRT